MSNYLKIALEAVTAAERVINKYYSKEIRSSLKPDQSPVTIADQEAEQIIRRHIQTAFPDHGILGEEAGTTQAESDFLWIIDPIDGTREFTRGLPFFSTLIALMKNNEFILGISSSPIMGELIYAEKGDGAWLNGQQIHVSEIDNLKNSFILGPAYKYLSRTNTFESVANIAQDVQGTRNVGGFLGYHWIASGKAEAMIEVDTFIYDIAPFVSVIQEAGGEITDLEGKPITLDTTAFLTSNKLLHQEILSYLKNNDDK